MTEVALSSGFQLTPTEQSRAVNSIIVSVAIWLGVFLSGFVINEPAPYELYMVGLIGIWALLGLTLPKQILPLISLLLLFNLGGIITMMVMPDWQNALIYVGVSFFLGFTAMFFAAIIAAKPERLKLIFAAYLAAALITGMLGILGYFGAIPGADLFTRFGRAKGAFQDPNVFAPFLCLPALYCLHSILTKPFTRTLPQMLCLLILAFAIFLSFSRAGWGLFVICSILLIAFLLINNPSGRFRVRLIILSVAAIGTLAVALLVALQFESVRELFLSRAQLVQDYDGARLGRFARHALGFSMAMENPFGIGILKFGSIFGEDPHNVYLKALTDYSWLGFASYVILIFWTLGVGLKILFRERPWQPFLLCAFIVFVGHVIIGYVIDTDHWRHFFLLLGIIWGCVGAEHQFQRKRRAL
ncbi:MAG: O-antigen ligase family protein [Ahrensia sp.]|nr:O-antigen ligase family protein [Ahrensia sp.]